MTVYSWPGTIFNLSTRKKKTQSTHFKRAPCLSIPATVRVRLRGRRRRTLRSRRIDGRHLPHAAPTPSSLGSSCHRTRTFPEKVGAFYQKHPQTIHSSVSSLTLHWATHVVRTYFEILDVSAALRWKRKGGKPAYWNPFSSPVRRRSRRRRAGARVLRLSLSHPLREAARRGGGSDSGRRRLLAGLSES
jgi:hypothetical protein